jgi:nicotinic acetylcholine receptor
VEVEHSGRMLWAFGGNFATSCTLYMTYYPFDIQKCNIVIDNWAYTNDLVTLRNSTSEIHEQDFLPNGEWDLQATQVTPTNYTEDTHPGKIFPRVIFTLYLHRKPLYYFINIVTPCLFCIIIAIMVFWLPPESGEKVSLGITVLLAFSVFQLVVADNTPKTSDFTPLLSEST